LLAIQQLIELGSDPLLLSEVLSAVLGQRLVRRLCLDCRIPSHPDTELLRRCRISPERESNFFAPPKHETGCERCGDAGFCGRIGMFELLTVNDAIRKLIREKASPSQLKTAARQAGMVALKENGFRLAIRGATSLDEILRAVAT
jgi:type II secretory ATPase GspE/PulE/Tfp pilus assembly ATPase PilB-like protein